jgi:hypothetical protein
LHKKDETMSDQPAPVAAPTPQQAAEPAPVQPQNAPPIQPPAQPQPQAQPQPAPPQQQDAGGSSSELSPGTTLRFTAPDGSTVRATLGDLVDRYNKASSAPDVDAETFQQFQVFQRAQQGDPEATRQLLESTVGTLSPQKEQPSVEERLAEYEKRLAQQEADLAAARRTTSQIDAVRGRNMINENVKAHAEDLPNLSKLPDPSEVVKEHLDVVKNRFQNMGYDLKNPQVQINLFNEALAEAEGRMSRYAAVFGGGQRPPASQPGITNDQPGPNATPTGPPPGLTVHQDGTVRDAYGRIMQQTSYGQFVPAGTVPPNIPGVPAGGAPTGVAATPANTANQPVSMNSLTQRMRARANELKTMGQ